MEQTIADWSLLESDWTTNQFEPYPYPSLPYASYYDERQPPPGPHLAPPQAQHHLPSPPPPQPSLLATDLAAPAILRHGYVPFPRGDNPREIRNKAEKHRRDKLNQSIAELAAMVPPVVAASRKIDKTGVLRLTAHYLRAHQYVFGDTLGQTVQDFSSSSAQAVLGFLRGFLLTTTYKGIIVVVSQNVNQYLGYNELELLGQNLFNITHEDDRQLLKEQLMPKSHLLGPNGELLVPDEPDGKQKVGEALLMDKRRFVVRFKKLAKRSEPAQYLSCHVEGCLRKSDRACRGYNRCCQMVRRARARGDNPCSSGNDVVFVGVVRPTTETFQTESSIEAFRMEYRTRHSVDGEIIQCEQRIALVTGYMTHEVHGVNAMNFMHRDDVRWVIIALREMYDSHRLVGESCYRLMTKSGQFIYMRTRGQLDVNHDSCAVTSFVCTNTVVEEDEGKHLIRMMKKRFTMLVNNGDNGPEDVDEEVKDSQDDRTPPVEDPRQLEKVILHLVTNLPSPQPEENPGDLSLNGGEPSYKHLAIIPPKKERIVSAIGNIYKVLKNIDTAKIDSQVVIKKDYSTTQNDPVPSTSQTEAPAQHFLLMAPIKPLVTLDDCKPYTPNPFNNTVLSYAQKSTANAIMPTEITNETITSGVVMPQLSTDNQYLVVFTPQNSVVKSSTIDEADAAQPGPSGDVSGLKRSNDFDDEVIKQKKKTQNTKSLENSELRSNNNSPSLESFFDEAILNTNIESVMKDLEQTDFPSFPDLLVSTDDVNDILAEIENDSQDQDSKP